MNKFRRNYKEKYSKKTVELLKEKQAEDWEEYSSEWNYISNAAVNRIKLKNLREYAEAMKSDARQLKLYNKIKLIQIRAMKKLVLDHEQDRKRL